MKIHLLMLFVFFLTFSLFFFSCECEEKKDDDDSGDDDQDDDDDDDATGTVFLNSPTDVTGDGEPDIVIVDYELEETEGEIQVELYDPDNGAFPTVISDSHNAFGGWDARLGDFDGDNFSEIHLATTYLEVTPVTEYRLLDGADLESVFSRSYASGISYSNVRPDFNGDGIVDFYVGSFNMDIFAARFIFYDATNEFDILWDSDETEQTDYDFFGTRKNQNFDTPADFGSLGNGWFVIERSSETGVLLYTFRVIDTAGNAVWIDGPSNLGGFGSAHALVGDFTGNDEDEILMLMEEDDGIDRTIEWGIYEAPDFDPVYEAEVLPDHEVYFIHIYDINNDGRIDLMMMDLDMTDMSFEISFLDAADNFEPFLTKGFTGDYEFFTAQFFGRRVASDRMIPTTLGEGSSDQFLFSIAEDTGGLLRDFTLYTFDPETGDLDPIRTYEEIAYTTSSLGDYDNDGIMEILSCPATVIDDGILDPYYESYCEILDGTPFDLIYRTDTYKNTALNQVRRLDLDFDDIPEPGYYTTAQSPESTSFFRVLDGMNNYVEKFAVEEDPGHSLRPLFLGR